MNNKVLTFLYFLLISSICLANANNEGLNKDYKLIKSYHPDLFYKNFGNFLDNFYFLNENSLDELDNELLKYVLLFEGEYCIPTTSNTGDHLSAISTANAVQNVNYTTTSSPAGNYADNTNQVIQQAQGLSFNISTTYVGGSNGVNVWVDWDDNGVFDNDAGSTEKVFSIANSNATKTGSITVPIGVPIGEYRMRVRGQFGSTANPEPCGLVNWGSTVDFKLQVLAAPNCFSPSNLTSGDTDQDSIDVSWTAPAVGGGNYDLYLSTSNVAPNEDTTPTTTSTTVNHSFGTLNPSTIYYIWVRTNCGDDDGVSFWTGPVEVTTTQVPTTLPYEEGFEAEHGWSFVHDSNNKWFIGEATNNGGANALYISNDQGENNAYTVAGAQVSHAYRDIMFPQQVGEVSLQFDWRCNGEGTANKYDYFRVWLVPVTFVPTAGTQITAANSAGVQLGLNAYNLNTAFLNENIVFDGSSYADESMRLIFEWRNDGNGGAQSPAAIDNINITLVACSAPSNLILGGISQDSIDVSWTAPGIGGGNYDLYLSTSNVAPNDTIVPTATSTAVNYSFDALNSSTVYYIWVRTNCGEDDGVSFWTGPLEVTTTQIPTTLPYEEGFEAEHGWSFIQDSNNTWFVGAAVNNGGANALYISNDLGENNAYTVSGAQVSHAYRDIIFPEDVGEVSLQFDWRCIGEGTTTKLDYFRVWLVPVTFVPTAGDQITIVNSAGIQLGLSAYNLNTEFLNENIVFDASANAGSSMRLVFEWRNSGSGGAQPPAAVDNISMTLITCSAPSNLISGDVDQDSFNVGWTAPVIGGGNYDLYLSTSNVAPDEATVPVVTTTDVTHTFDTLNSSTLYYVWVRTNCGVENGTSFWTGPLVVSTLQIPVTLPYEENFEGEHGWSTVNALVNQWFVGDAVNNGGNNAMYISNDSGVSNAYTTNPQSQVSHIFRLVDIPENVNDLLLGFDWRCVGETSEWDYFRVWLTPVTYVPVQGVQTTTANSGGIRLQSRIYNANPSFLHENLIFDGSDYAGQTMQLIFEWRNDTSGGNQPPAAIDNISMAVITCYPPANLEVTDVTTSTIQASWEAPATGGGSYNVYISTSNTLPGASTVPTATTANTNYTFTNLDSSITYYIWVRTNCGTADGNSYWVGPAEMNTLQVPGTLPYHEDFEGENNWTLVNDSTNEWFVGNAVNNGGTRAMYISNNNGVANEYTINVLQVSHAYRDLAIPLDAVEGQLSFDWRAFGEGTADYVRVWLVPTTYLVRPGILIAAGADRQQIGQFNREGTFSTYQEILDLEAFEGGTVRLVFEWRNDGSVGTQPPGAIDNVNLVVSECPALRIFGFCETSDSLDFYWERRSEEIGWQVAFEEADLPEPNPDNVEFVTDTGKVYEDLLEETEYYFYIRTVCDEDTYGLWQKITAKTSNLSILGAEPFCAGPEGIIFPNVFGPGTVAERNTYGRVACLGNTPSAVWYFLKIEESGDLLFDIIQNTSFDDNGTPNGRGLDVDFVAFGPFDDLGEACRNIDLGPCPAGFNCSSNNNAGTLYPIDELNIVDCNYSSAPIEQMRIYGAQEGEIYAILITNYNGDEGFIKLVQTNAEVTEAGTTDCKFLCEVDLGEDQIFCEGEVYTIKAKISAAGSVEEMTYTWFKDGVLLDTEEFNTTSITVFESGVYSVLVEKDLCEENPTDEVVIKFVKPFDKFVSNNILLCDLQNLGTVEFDLLGFAEEAISRDLTPENLTFDYYHTLEDLQMGQNVINLTSFYSSAGNESVYLKITREGLSNCFFSKEIALIINPTLYPVAEFSYESPICVNNISGLNVIPVEGFTEGGVFSYSNGKPGNPSGLVLNKSTGFIDVEASVPGKYSVTYTYSIPSDSCGEKKSHTTELTIFERFQISYEGDCYNGKYYLRVVDLLNNLDLNSSTYTWEGPGGFTDNKREIQVSRTGIYTVYFETKDGCYEELEIDLSEIDCMIQKGISPNGDGLNDFFDLSRYKVIKLSIFNRYGTEVYSHGIGYTNEWYGQGKSSNLLPDGTYFYEIQTLSEVLTGWIQINK